MGRMPHSEPQGEPGSAQRPALDTLVAWLDAGLALRVAPWLDGLCADPAPDAVLQGSRALRQLGADRQGDALAMRLARRHPGHPLAVVALLRSVLGSQGTHACWRALQRHPLPASASAVERAARLSFEGVWLAELRDDAAALALQRQALALDPQDPWLYVEHAGSLLRIDRATDALAAARDALALAPEYRTALQMAARVLQHLHRNDEARALLEPALARTGAAWYAWQLHGMAQDEQRHADALVLLDQVEAALPRAEKSWRLAIAARRSDALLALGRTDEAREQAERMPGPGFYARLAERLRAPAPVPEARSTLLPMAMVQQHWMTCAPATLTALSGYWGRAADHLEVAQAICYDGTPQASERRWAAEQGFHVREFTLDWDTSCALVEAGMPFALTTQHVGGGHLQAVVGVDRLRRSLLIRDPSQPLHAEYDADLLFDLRQSPGPRAMVMLPPEQLHRLEGITLPDAADWDLSHAVLAALQRHDRPTAMQALAQLQARAPAGDATLRSRRYIALYDGDEPGILAVTEALLERHPDDRQLQQSRLTSLFEVRGQAAGEAWLAELVARPHPDAYLLTRWAARLMLDARRLPQAMGVVAQALRRDGGNGRAWSQLADQLWAAQGVADSVAPARWASTLLPTEEWAAAAYARTCRVAGRPEEGLAWLRERVATWGDRSVQPTITLAEELDAQQRDAEAEAALGAALQQRPEDAALRLFLAERALWAGQLDAAQAHLQACTDARAPALLRLQALLLEARGELDAALAAVQQAVDLEPLHLPHHRLLLRLLRRRHGDIEALAQWRPRADAHPAHLGLQRLLYDALPDQPAAINAQLDHLHAQHPALPWLQRERAVQASRQDRHDEAVALAEAAAALAPELATSHDVLAFCHQRRSGYAAALPHVQQALRRDAEYESALRRILDVHESAALRAAADFAAAELRRQVILGDGLLVFQAEAGSAWPAEETLALLDELCSRWPALWQGPVAQARQLMRMHRADEALALLEAAAARFPSVPRLHVELGEALRLAGRIEAARAANGRAVAQQPGWNRAVRAQVDLLCLHGREWDAAEQVLQRALHTRDAWDDADLIALLAWVQEGQGRDAEALASARKSLLSDPRPDWVWGLVRRLCDRMETPAAFDALIDAVVTERPGDVDAWLVRAERGRDDIDALAAAERAIALQPRHVPAWRARLSRLQRLGRLDLIEQALAALPWPAPAPLALRAWGPRLSWARAEHSRAIRELRALREEAPYDEALCVQLADWLDERDEHAAYLEAAEALLVISPLEARSHLYRGHALLKAGRAQEALAPLQRTLELAPGYVFAARQLVQAARTAQVPDAAEPALLALWPLLEDVETACDGVELAVAAGQRERAQAWLQRLFTCEAFEIDRCRTALAAWRQAGWADTLEPQLDAHVARGGGPVGVAIDWLERERERRGVLLTALRAFRLQRRAAGPHLLRALLRWLADHEARLLLGLQLRHFEPALRADDTAWGESSYALARLNEHRALVRWLRDWQQRERPPAYALGNLVGSLAVLRRWDELARVVQATLARQPYQEDMRLWQLLLLARSGDLDGLQAALARTHEWQADPWMLPQLKTLRAFVVLALERAGGNSVAAFRRTLEDGVIAQALVWQRELRRLAMWRHTPWTRLPQWGSVLD